MATASQETSVQVGQVVLLVVIGFAVFLGWSYSRGNSRGVTLYILGMIIVFSLLGAAGADGLQLSGAAEGLNLAAIALSLAGLAGSPPLWEQELAAAYRETRLHQPIRARDLVSWRGWLKLVDRFGALCAALAWLAMFACALAANLVAWGLAHPDGDRTFVLLALATPGLFGLLSTIWIYRGAQRLVPHA